MNRSCHCQTKSEQGLMKSDEFYGSTPCLIESTSHELEVFDEASYQALNENELDVFGHDEAKLEMLLWVLEEEERLRYEEEEERRLRWEEELEEERRRWDLEEEARYFEEEEDTQCWEY